MLPLRACGLVLALSSALIWASTPPADLREAQLGRADLRRKELRGANLRDANLGRADLTGADLTTANLRGANLIKTHLAGARLPNADLREVPAAGAPEHRCVPWGAPRPVRFQPPGAYQTSPSPCG